MLKKSGEVGKNNPASPVAVRTCIGCRRFDSREELVRLVVSNNDFGEPELLVDVRRRLPGRGAWLHSSLDCLKLAIKRRSIARAFPGVSNVSDVERELVDLYNQVLPMLQTDNVPL